MGRQAKGVRLIRLDEDQTLVGIASIWLDHEEGESQEPVTPARTAGADEAK
jgi:hypothetical protein